MFSKIMISYLLVCNLTGFIMMGLDKRRARRHQRRLPEKRLFAFAFLGGSLGSLLGMLAWRHKTKHLKFTLGIPAILLAQIALAILAWYLWQLYV
jgi:uncharacterized membrane protein YsdA (DUF1294 family)